MQFEKAYSFLLDKLEEKLPKWLTYHNLQHTKDVVAAVQYLAKCENASETEYKLLSTAAAFHDAGFIEGYDDHEEISCGVAMRYLPQFDYDEKDIQQVGKLIMVTKLPQVPKNYLEEIICDADLLYLGTDKFAEISETLYHEFMKRGKIHSRKDWNEKQYRFLNEHHFFTTTAIVHYAPKKQENFQLFYQSLNDTIE